MELGVGEALTSFLDEDGVPGIAQRTSIICPQSLMAPTDEETRKLLMTRDGMSKYDVSVDNYSAYEDIMGVEPEEETTEELIRAVEPDYGEQQMYAQEQYDEEQQSYAQAQSDTEESAVKRRQREWEAEQRAKEEAVKRKEREKEEAAERKQKEREEAAAKKKKEKEEEAARKKKEKAAERRKAQIERQLINTGMQVLKRGLLNTLFK